MEFEFLETSLNSDGLVAIKNEKATSIFMSLLPVGVPPILKSIEDNVKEYLTNYLEDQSLYSFTTQNRLVFL